MGLSFWLKLIYIYKLIFLSLTIISTVVNTGVMVDFSSMLFLMMALPNILGLFILSGDVKTQLNVYMAKLKSGELDAEAIR